MKRASPVLLECLDAHHDVSTFDSRNEVLDTWLRRHALAAQSMDWARTFVATRSGHVVGYFSLTMGSVLRTEALRKAVATGEVAGARLIVVMLSMKTRPPFASGTASSKQPRTRCGSTAV